MPKKIMKISSIFKNKEAKQPWQYWPLCMHPNTLSFRASNDETIFKLVDITPPEILLVNSIECASFSTDHREENESSFEVVINEVRLSSSERLFFEPNETSSIVKEAKGTNCNNHHDGMFVFKGSVALEMESDDPYLDFKKSMQEMVESIDDHQGNNLLLKDDNWDYLEELLGWYLRFNVKMNHGFIIGAFLDLLIELVHASASASSSSPEMKNKPMLSCFESSSYSSASSSFSSHST